MGRRRKAGRGRQTNESPSESTTPMAENRRGAGGADRRSRGRAIQADCSDDEVQLVTSPRPDFIEWT